MIPEAMRPPLPGRMRPEMFPKTATATNAKPTRRSKVSQLVSERILRMSPGTEVNAIAMGNFLLAHAQTSSSSLQKKTPSFNRVRWVEFRHPGTASGYPPQHVNVFRVGQAARQCIRNDF